MSERGSFLEQLTRDKEAVVRLEVEVKTLKGKNLSLQEELEKAVHKLDIYNKVGFALILFSFGLVCVWFSVGLITKS